MQYCTYQKTLNSVHSLDIEKLKSMFRDITKMKERNRQILKAFEEGYSRHKIAKVLSISQQTVGGVVKRSKK